MKIGPKYKIARRLGAPVFEKTQTSKYTLSLARKEKSGFGSTRPKSEFGKELVEKQKARFSYGLADRQFKNYAIKALRSLNPVQTLFATVEKRVDNVLFRSGLTKSRAQARQVASHGHILLNGRRITIPSIILRVGDTLSLRIGSTDKPLFSDVIERMKTVSIPAWLEVVPEERRVIVKGEPIYQPGEHVFDLGTVVEFYNR